MSRPYKGAKKSQIANGVPQRIRLITCPKRIEIRPNLSYRNDNYLLASKQLLSY
jgi:hypothetical protein